MTTLLIIREISAFVIDIHLNKYCTGKREQCTNTSYPASRSGWNLDKYKQLSGMPDIH